MVTGLDEMAVGGSYGVAVDAAGADLRSPAPLDGVIQTDDDGLPLFYQLRHQEAGEPSCEVAGVSAGAVEDLVTGGMVGGHRPAGDAQAGGHGAFAGCRQGAHDEDENEAPGRGCECASNRFKPDAQVLDEDLRKELCKVELRSASGFNAIGRSTGGGSGGRGCNC